MLGFCCKYTLIEFFKFNPKIHLFLAWQNANMDKELKQSRAYTVLIPTDEAFEKLPKDTKEKLMSGDDCAKSKYKYICSTIYI